MINGVIFDMDGLMFDTERMWATFWEPALAALGLEYKEGLAEAERGTAGETSRNIVRQFYGEDCAANAIIDSLHRVADEEFQKPVPTKPGLDELLPWLDANHIPLAVASSSRVHVIEGNLNNWGLTHYFKACLLYTSLLNRPTRAIGWIHAKRWAGKRAGSGLVLLLQAGDVQHEVHDLLIVALPVPGGPEIVRDSAGTLIRLRIVPPHLG